MAGGRYRTTTQVDRAKERILSVYERGVKAHKPMESLAGYENVEALLERLSASRNPRLEFYNALKESVEQLFEQNPTTGGATSGSDLDEDGNRFLNSVYEGVKEDLDFLDVEYEEINADAASGDISWSNAENRRKLLNLIENSRQKSNAELSELLKEEFELRLKVLKSKKGEVVLTPEEAKKEHEKQLRDTLDKSADSRAHQAQFAGWQAIGAMISQLISHHFKMNDNRPESRKLKNIQKESGDGNRPMMYPISK